MVPTGLQTRYGRFIKHFQKIYEHRERQGREVRSLDHYYNVANYLRENGADPVLILAGLYKGIIDPEHVKIPGISSFGDKEDRSLLRNVQKVLGNYVALVKAPIELNEKMAANLSEENDFRASILRAVTLLHLDPETEEKKTFTPKPETYDQLLGLYATLAHALGNTKVKYDLMEKQLHPEERKQYERLKIQLNRLGHPPRHLNSVKTRLTNYLQSVLSRERIRENLDLNQHGVSIRLDPRSEDDVKIDYREKHPVSVWYKMKRKRLNSPEQVGDLHGIRIILNTNNIWKKIREETNTSVEARKKFDLVQKALVHHVASGILHGYSDHLQKGEEVDDYVTNPKPSGYSAYHIPLRINGKNVEVQVLTDKMHENNELGRPNTLNYKELASNIDAVFKPRLTEVRRQTLKGIPLHEIIAKEG